MFPVVVMAALVVSQGGSETARTGMTYSVIVDARVQQELGLTEAQKVAVWDIRWKTSGRLGDFVRENMRRKKAPDFRKALKADAEVNAAMLNQLAEVLDRRQLARYDQIRLQYLRDEVLLDRGVQKALKMEPDQVKKVVSLFVGYLEENTRRLLASNKLPFAEQIREVPQRMREDIERREKMLKQMGEVLTDKQRVALAGLRGRIFKPAGRERIGSWRADVPIPEAVRRRK
jgi:hypothetical protein